MYLSLETCLSDSENCNILWPKQLAASKCRLKALESTCQARFLKKRCTLRLFCFDFFRVSMRPMSLTTNSPFYFCVQSQRRKPKKEEEAAASGGGDASRCSSIRCWNQMHRWGVSSMKHCGGLFKKDALSFDCKTTFIWKMVSVFKWLSRLCLVCPVWGAA